MLILGARDNDIIYIGQNLVLKVIGLNDKEGKHFGKLKISVEHSNGTNYQERYIHKDDFTEVAKDISLIVAKSKHGKQYKIGFKIPENVLVTRDESNKYNKNTKNKNVKTLEEKETSIKSNTESFNIDDWIYSNISI